MKISVWKQIILLKHVIRLPWQRDEEKTALINNDVSDK